MASISQKYTKIWQTDHCRTNMYQNLAELDTTYITIIKEVPDLNKCISNDHQFYLLLVPPCQHLVIWAYKATGLLSYFEGKLIVWAVITRHCHPNQTDRIMRACFSTTPTMYYKTRAYYSTYICNMLQTLLSCQNDLCGISCDNLEREMGHHVMQQKGMLAFSPPATTVSCMQQ